MHLILGIMHLLSNKAETSERAKAWYRGKTGFTVIMLFISVIIASALVGVYLYGHRPQTNNLTCFTCFFASSDQTFTIDLDVNLTDGMDQNEAIKVATEVFFKVAEMTYKRDVSITESLAHVREEGTWTVGIDYVEFVVTEPVHQTHLARFSPIPGYFEAVINPFDHTIAYSFQHHGL